MGEIKGQLLSVLLVMVIFGAIAGALYAAFKSTNGKLMDHMNSEETNISKPKSAQQFELLEFHY